MKRLLLALVLLCLPSQAFAFGGGHWASWAHRPWAVDDIPNCVMHLRADRGVTLNTTTVSGWADQTTNGSNAVQASATSQPLFESASFNGQPSVKWDGSNDIMTVAGIGASLTGTRVPWTWIAAEQWVTLIDNGAAFYWSSGGAGFYRMLENTSEYRSVFRDDTSNLISTDNPAADTNGHVLSVVVAGSTESLFLDNTARADNPVTTPPNATTTTAFSLGALGVNSLAANIRYAEILFCTRALSATERFLAEHQIATRQGVTLN